jgi:hypothetical protein
MESRRATSKSVIRAAAHWAVSGRAANLDLNDHQFWARLIPAVLHDPQEIDPWRQSAAAPGAAAAMNLICSHKIEQKYM